ncbi:hypothetical protein DFJ74DRAFT_168536 [Hyaloraphidium curvatum]|nr:hypothetical protein DFJ74DRAFT_168536 [Hyaloraphidium curvatum]
MSGRRLTVAVLTVSDRAASGSIKDEGGPAVLDELKTQPGWEVVQTKIVSDSVSEIQAAIRAWTDDSSTCVGLVITTGGTGFGVRDVTPEAVLPLLDKLAPGLPMAMMNESLKKTPFAVLARPVAGVRRGTLVITLPGSPKGARENLRAVLAVLPHAIELAQGDSGQAVHTKMASRAEASDEHDCSAADSYVPPGGHTRPQERSDHSHDHSHDHGHDHGHDHSHRSGHARRKEANGLHVPVARRPRTSPYKLFTVDEAHATIAKFSHQLPVIRRKVDENLLGHVVAEDAVATEDVPGYRASIVDGYAVIASDGPGEYPVLAPSTAGGPPVDSYTLQPGQIARVTTGAPVPPGTTGVVMVEYTTVEKASSDGQVEERVRIHEPVEEGENIREVGVDCKAGTLVMRKGEEITLVGGEIGILASVGLAEVSVYRRPRVGVLSSGNEVVDIAQQEGLRYGQVRDTNRPSLIAALRACGFEAVDLGIASDDADSLAASISAAIGPDAAADRACDVLITTGGVSMGELDLLKPVLEQRLSGTIQFGRVQMKPGKPTTFVTVPGKSPADPPKLVFALPGNPVSALVTFYVFVLPGLRKMAGHARHHLPTIKCQLAHDVRLDPRPEYQRAFVGFEGGSLVSSTTGVQRSSRMLSMKGANALLVLPAIEGDKKSLAKGSTVDAMLISALGT